MLVFGLYKTVGYTLTTASGIFAGQRTERRIFSAQNFSFAQNLVYKGYIGANGLQSYEKHCFKSQDARIITQFSIFRNSTWNASSQSKMFARSFTFIDWKYSFEKSQFYLSFDFFWSNFRVMRLSQTPWRSFYLKLFHRLFKSENNEDKVSNKEFFPNVLPEFLSLF